MPLRLQVANGGQRNPYSWPLRERAVGAPPLPLRFVHHLFLKKNILRKTLARAVGGSGGPVVTGLSPLCYIFAGSQLLYFQSMPYAHIPTTPTYIFHLWGLPWLLSDQTPC